jgi:predicted transposase/invertase (TIGR01784 family)
MDMKEEGREEGREQGILECQADMIGKLLSKGYTCADIADMLDMDKNEIEKIQAEMLQTV